MPDLEALEAQVAALTARLAAPELPAPPPQVVAPAEPAASRPVRLYTLVGSPDSYLHRDPREVRRLAEAVALCRGAASPAQEIPADWLPELRRLAAARAAGRSWVDALAQAGLVVPGNLHERAHTVRLELNHLWDRLLPLVGQTLDNVNSVARNQTTKFLKHALIL